MNLRETAIPGVVVIEPARFGDARGFFSESWSRRRLADAGIDVDFVQDNHSISEAAGTLRGLHYQRPPHAQAKLVRCGRGRLFDVVVDARKGSPAFGQWIGEELSFDNGLQIYVPAGCLHGFVTREPMTEILYKCSDYYAPEADGSIRWDSCGIDWRLAGAPVLSAKDAEAVPFSDFDSPFEWTGA